MRCTTWCTRELPEWPIPCSTGEVGKRVRDGQRGRDPLPRRAHLLDLEDGDVDEEQLVVGDGAQCEACINIDKVGEHASQQQHPSERPAPVEQGRDDEQRDAQEERYSIRPLVARACEERVIAVQPLPVDLCALPAKQLAQKTLLGTSVNRLCGCLPCRSFCSLLYPFEHPLLHDEVGNLDA